MTPANEQAAGCTTTATAQGKQTQRKFTSAPISTEAQIALLAYLLLLGPRHTHELRRHGISHPAGRVQDLLRRNWVIASDRVTTVDSDGFAHSNVSLYSVVSAPDATSGSRVPSNTGDLFDHAEGAPA